MKVILKSTNQIKDIPYGYAVNYLLPRGLAVKATELNLEILEKQQETKNQKQKAIDEEDRRLAAKIDGHKIILPVATGKKDKIFGSVTKNDILSQLSIFPARVEVLLDKPIKKLGKYEIDLKIGQSRAKIEIEVISK